MGPLCAALPPRRRVRHVLGHARRRRARLRARRAQLLGGRRARRHRGARRQRDQHGLRLDHDARHRSQPQAARPLEPGAALVRRLAAVQGARARGDRHLRLR
eukprot:1120648-Prymnesium_polylepis.1